jgi:hypothetical protein
MPDTEHPQTNSIAIARLQEQGRGMSRQLTDLGQQISALDTDLSRQISALEVEMKSTFTKHVTQVEFSPFKLMVTGVIGIIVAAVIGALVSLVVKQ